MNDLKITCIVPVYNAIGYLDRCVDSIVQQTYQNIEIILVDDGSKDGSSERCDLWATWDKRIISIHKKNGGAASARNTGLNAATGQFIMFVDSDDYLDESMCQTLMTHMLSNNVDCIVCGYRDFDIHDNEHIMACSTSITMPSIEALKNRYLKQQYYLNIINPWGKIYKRKLWDEIRFKSGIYYEDLEVTPRLYIKNFQIEFIPYIGYHYFVRNGSCAHGVGEDLKRYTDSVIIRNEHFELYRKNNEYELAAESIVKCLELAFSADMNGWISKEMSEANRFQLLDNWKFIRKYSKLNMKEKIKYDLYLHIPRNVLYKFLEMIGKCK